jgi:hypothetical protein
MVEFEGDLNLGKLGETKLSEWCTAARLTSNQSLEEDKMGWDHLIEFPYEKSILPRDKQPKPIECKVQVKSTLRTDKGVNIKLSALKRLVDYTSPAFILFYEFSDNEDPFLDSSYLVHVDKRLIERVLKKIRQNDTSKNPKKLNKIELRISYSKKHKLRANSGFVFRDSIVALVPDGIAEYQKNKHELTENIGYEEHGYEFKFEASTQELTRFFTESALGITDSLTVKNTIVSDNRFNLKNGKVEIKKADEVKFSVLPSTVDKCKLRFKTSKYSPAITFDAEFIKMPQPTTGKNSLFMKTTLFSIEIDHIDDSSISGKYHLTNENDVELDEAIKFFKLFSPNNFKKNLILELDLLNVEGTIGFSINFPFELPDPNLIIETIEVLQKSFEIDGKTVTNLNELYDSKSRFNVLSSVIQSNVSEMKFSLTKVHKDSKFFGQPEIKTPFHMIASIGSVSIGVIALLHGKKITDYEYQVYKAEILKPLTFHNEQPTQKLIEELVEEEIKKLEFDKAELK